jgi:hypothetical protein
MSTSFFSSVSIIIPSTNQNCKRFFSEKAGFSNFFSVSILNFSGRYPQALENENFGKELPAGSDVFKKGLLF